MGKITELELKNIQEQQLELNKVLGTIGYLSAQKHSELHKVAGINENINEQKRLLEEKYGPVNINLEDGTYTEVETDGK
jgi:hypothetical protein